MVNDSPLTPSGPDRPEDFDGLRAELAEFVDDFVPVADDLWPRLEDHRSRWDLYRYGLQDGYDRLVASDIIEQLNTALINLGSARDRLTHALLKADSDSPDS